MKIFLGFLAMFLLLASQPALAADSKIAVLKMGSAKVIALSDIQTTVELSSMLTPQDLEQTKIIIPDGKVNSYVNAYVIQTGEANILFDAGVGQAAGGQLIEALQEAGIKPEEINLVLLTHLHLDHCGGLFNDNKPVFANADIWVAKAEADYWSKTVDFPPSQQASVSFARQVLASPKLKIYEPGQAMVSGLTSFAGYGHTPGHSIFLFNSGGKTLLIWGDIVHLTGLQFARPELGVVYDVDSTKAVQIRKLLLAKAHAEKQIVAGMHLVFPGWGMVEKPANEQDIKYMFVPLADN